MSWRTAEPLGEGVGYFPVGPPVGFTSLRQLPLLVLFGTTGVGKSTTLRALDAEGIDLHLLPDRRELTSRLVVAPQRQAEGRAEEALVRLDRYRYVQAFREEFPGGMVHLLEGLAVVRRSWPGVLVFDGLRGRSEAERALEGLPSAIFLVLTCPEFVRLGRLLERADPHDRATGESSCGSEIPEEQLRGFSEEERSRLRESVASGRWDAEDVATKLRILAQDRATHDPDGARLVLDEAAPGRTLVFDTSKTEPGAIARATARWLLETFPSDLEGGDVS